MITKFIVNLIVDGYMPILIGVLCLNVFCLVLFFKACIDIKAIRQKIAPSSKQILKNSKTEPRADNTSESEA